MKNLFFLLPFALLVFTACEKEQASFPYNEAYAQQMAAQTNTIYGLETQDISSAFTGEGSIVAKLLQETYEGETYDFLSLQYTGTRNGAENVLIAFDIDLRFGDFKFPEHISNAQVTFLGNQLLVRNLDTDYSMNFFVKEGPESENAFPKLEPQRISSLRIVHEEEGFDKRQYGCICFCSQMPFAVSPGGKACDCKSKNCGNSCSVSCDGDPRALAVCIDHCPIP